MPMFPLLNGAGQLHQGWTMLSSITQLAALFFLRLASLGMILRLQDHVSCSSCVMPNSACQLLPWNASEPCENMAMQFLYRLPSPFAPMQSVQMCTQILLAVNLHSSDSLYVFCGHNWVSFCIQCLVKLITVCKAPACFAAGNFPIGLTSSGTPTSLQFVGPPGHDSTILSLLLAAETLFGDFPAPPNPSVCSGCVSNVTTQQVTHPCDRHANTRASD